MRSDKVNQETTASNNASSGEGNKTPVNQVVGESDHEFPHIVSVNGKIHCNNCGAWQWLAHWQLFLNKHDDCISG